MNFNRYIYIFLGALLGATLRISIIFGIAAFNLPFMSATFVVNMLGAFLFGMVFIRFQNAKKVLVFSTGCLGAFTTFSTLSLELSSLLDLQAFLSFSIYLILSMFLGVLVFVLGVKVGKKNA